MIRSYFSQDKDKKLQLELTDLRNVEEPQSEDLKPLVCIKHRNAAIRCVTFNFDIELEKYPKDKTVVTTLLQEDELQEIISKISSKRANFEEARAQMAKLKEAYEEAEREYNQHKEQINAVAEEADPIKVKRCNPTSRFRCFWRRMWWNLWEIFRWSHHF